MLTGVSLKLKFLGIIGGKLHIDLEVDNCGQKFTLPRFAIDPMTNGSSYTADLEKLEPVLTAAEKKEAKVWQKNKRYK